MASTGASSTASSRPSSAEQQSTAALSLSVSTSSDVSHAPSLTRPTSLSTSPPVRLHVQTSSPAMPLQLPSSTHGSPAVTPRRHRSVMISPPSGGGGIPGVALASPRKIKSNVSTFKICSFVLGYSSTPCPARSEPAYSLSLDNTAQIVTFVSLTEKDSSSSSSCGVTHYSRHLSSIHSAYSDPTDVKRITLTFRDSTRPGGIGVVVVKAYAMTASEARMIIELLQLMIDDYITKSGVASSLITPAPFGAASGDISSAPSSGDETSPVSQSSLSPPVERAIADTDVIWIGRVLKRGRVSFSPRWLVLKKFYLRVYKSNKLHVPSNNISLSGAKITASEEKPKYLHIDCPDRPYTFKFSDVIERDHVLSLFQKAMEVRPGTANAAAGQSSVTAAASSQANSSLSNSSPLPFPSNDSSTAGDSHRPHLARAQSNSAVANYPQTPPGDQTRRQLSARRASATSTRDLENGLGTPGSLPFTHPHHLSHLNPTPNQLLLPVAADDHHHGSPPVGSATPAAGRGVMRFPRFNLNSGGDTDSRERERDQLSELPPGMMKRRKSRRTISRDFQSILSKPTSHATTIDDAAQVGGFSTGGFTRKREIEFAEYDIPPARIADLPRPGRTLQAGIYAFMATLRDSIAAGAHLSPTLYVPKSVWYQHGAKFHAFNVKLDVLETVRVSMLTILPPKAYFHDEAVASGLGTMTPNTASALANVVAARAANPSAAASASNIGQMSAADREQTEDEVERLFVAFRLCIEDTQDKLAQHLSCIHTVKDPYRLKIDKLQKVAKAQAAAEAQQQKSAAAAAAAAVGSSGSFANKIAPTPTHHGHHESLQSALAAANASAAAAAAQSAGASIPNSGEKPEKGVLTLGEKLSKSMKTFGKIVTRAASATKDKVDQEDSTKYVRLLHAIFDQSFVFRDWLAFLEGPSGDLISNKAALEEHLARINEWFYAVLCNLVIRDLKSILKRYMKHMVRTLSAQ